LIDIDRRIERWDEPVLPQRVHRVWAVFVLRLR
jgi:hypothetical protein